MYMHPVPEHPDIYKVNINSLKREADCNTTIVGDFTPHFQQREGHLGRKINKKLGVKLYSRQKEPDKHLQNISSNGCRIYIILMGKWNILQDRP